jgi:hypothetical protein
MPTITSSTAVFLLSVASVFPAPVQLQGFGPDEAFDTEQVDVAVTQLGVDGTGVSGYVPREVTQTITFLASSPSVILFQQWMASQDVIQDVLYATGSIRIPSLGLKYDMPQGTLRRFQSAPDARRVMMPVRYSIVWQPQPGIPAITASPL